MSTTTYGRTDFLTANAAINYVARSQQRGAENDQVSIRCYR